MKNKTTFLIFTIALVLVSVFALTTFCNEKEKEQPTITEEPKQETLHLTEEETQEDIYEVYEIPSDSIYYNYKSISDLVYYRETGDTATEYIGNIHCTEHGTAGSSYKIARSGYLFILLATMQENELSGISSYLDEMTSLQIDFLSYQLMCAFEYALEVADGKASPILTLEELSADEKIYKSVEKHELIDFMYFMQQLLEEKGNEYEWENLNMQAVV